MKYSRAENVHFIVWLIAIVMVALLLLTGCTNSRSYERYRSIEIASGPYGTVCTVFETWDQPNGWDTPGSVLLSSQVFPHASPLGQLAQPAAIVGAAAVIDVSEDVTVNQSSGRRRK